MATDNLQIADVQANQNNKEVTINEAFNALDNAMNRGTLVTVTGDTTLTSAQTTRHTILVVIGTPSADFNLDMPDANQRVLSIVNVTNFTATVRSDIGAGVRQPVIPPGDTTTFFFGGVDFRPIASTSESPNTVVSELNSVAAANYDVLAVDNTKYTRMTLAGPKTFTVQPDADEALPANGEWHIRNAGASGDITIVQETGVVVNPPNGGTLVMSPGMTATLKRVAINTFDLLGQTVSV